MTCSVAATSILTALTPPRSNCLDTQPGWTDGPNNTIFFKDGTTLQNQAPPASIQGNLDPVVEPGGPRTRRGGSISETVTIRLRATAGAKGDRVELDLTDAPRNTTALLVAGRTRIDALLASGTLVPSPEVVLPLRTDGRGEIRLELDASKLPLESPGLILQVWVSDPSVGRYAASNGVLVQMRRPGGAFAAGRVARRTQP